jgi:hypothetical protein
LLYDPYTSQHDNSSFLLSPAIDNDLELWCNKKRATPAQTTAFVMTTVPYKSAGSATEPGTYQSTGPTTVAASTGETTTTDLYATPSAADYAATDPCAAASANAGIVENSKIVKEQKSFRLHVGEAPNFIKPLGSPLHFPYVCHNQKRYREVAGFGLVSFRCVSFVFCVYFNIHVCVLRDS